MEELRAKLDATQGSEDWDWWYLFESQTVRVSPTTLHARETGTAAVADLPRACEPRGTPEAAYLEADDAWLTSFVLSTRRPAPATPTVSPEDQQLMQQKLVGQWGFSACPKHLYSRSSARVMLAEQMRGTMAYESEQISKAEGARLADLFLDSFSERSARFICNWFGPSTWTPIDVTGKEHTFDFVMVGVQSDRIAAVASSDGW